MTDGACMGNPELAWSISSRQPIPQCLGDFLKLLGRAMPKPMSLENGSIHITAEARVWEPGTSERSDGWLCAIHNTMEWARQHFVESDMSGELGKYGNFPSVRYQVEDDDAAARLGYLRLGDAETTATENAGGLDIISRFLRSGDPEGFRAGGSDVPLAEVFRSDNVGVSLAALQRDYQTQVEHGASLNYREIDDFHKSTAYGCSDEGLSAQYAFDQAGFFNGHKPTLLQYAQQTPSHMWSAHEQNLSINRSQREE
jgi:hypothetical protein